MAEYRKTRTLKRGLGKLDQREKDYMENLANSLLEIQNTDPPQSKPKKTAAEKGKKANGE